MKTVRRISQIFFLALFVLLFFQTVRFIDWADGNMKVAAWLPADFFLRIDPLLGWTSIFSARSFLLSVALWTIPVIVLTLLFGRAFCGWICPLGTCIDGADKVIRSKKERRTNKEISWPRLKYYILGALAVSVLFGSHLVWFLDPIPLFLRSLTLGVFGPLDWAHRAISGIPGLHAVSARLNGIFPEQPTTFRSGFLALSMIALIFAGAALSRRLWCRSLCPLGALLGLIARFPIFRRRIGSQCTECTLCGLDCKMNAIGEKGKDVNSSECIYCFSCSEICRKDAVRMSPGQPQQSLPLNFERRRLMTGLGVGAIWGLAAKDAITKRPTRDGDSHVTNKYLIRPPGSVAEELFTERCVRCGECMKVCPNSALQPALTEAGLAGIWTPILQPRVGECSQNCSMCGQVCPTHAIMPFTPAEKEHIYMGRAAINRSTCVVWESGKQCLVCDEVCSYDAVYWVDESGSEFKIDKQNKDGENEKKKRNAVPHVDPARCVGCGICENNCPVGGPEAAIRVTRDGDKRHLSRDQQKAWQKDHWVEREQ
jgi:polyferredoxin